MNLNPVLDNCSDEYLARQVGEGNQAAMDELWRRHSCICHAVALRIAGDFALAEDCVQDAFFRFWQRNQTFDPTRGAFRSWLLTIVRHIAIDRRRGVHGRSMHDVGLDEIEFRVASHANDPFTLASNGIDATRVRAALLALPPEQREAIELAFFGGLTHKEIAVRTGAALGTVKGRMRLGLLKMRPMLFDLDPAGEALRPAA